MIKTNTILNGDALEHLKELPSESINCVMTSPPYWALRDYGVEGQLGLEPTFEEFISKLCDIFDEVKRVLRKDGTCWVNLGDTYASSPAGNKDGQMEKQLNSGDGVYGRLINRYGGDESKFKPKDFSNVQSKSLVMIPFRFAIEMVNRGWILRNTIIWHKPNCMPSSVKDRFTVDFEYLFFFTKSKKYWFETQREPHKLSSIERTKHSWDGHREPMSSYAGMKMDKMCHPEGKNKRAVWSINPKPFTEAHFAVYPEELCEIPIKAGCPKFVCNECKNPKVMEIEYDRSKMKEGVGATSGQYWNMRDNKKGNVKKGDNTRIFSGTLKGYKPTCNCNAEFTGGIVLDPFFGAGTTGVVALKQNKQFIGIEISKEYIEIAKKRLKPFLEQTKLECV